MTMFLLDGYTRPTRLATTASDGFLFLIHFLAKDVAHENRLLSSSNNIAVRHVEV